MKFLPNTDIRYFYNLKSDTQYRYRYPIPNMPYFETTFEVQIQKLKLKHVFHSLCNYYYYDTFPH